MTEKLKYHGKTVFLEIALVRGGWNWTYSIEGGHHFCNPDTPLPSRKMALKEASNAALHAIDIEAGEFPRRIGQRRKQAALILPKLPA